MTDTLTYNDTIQNSSLRVQRIGYTIINGVKVVRYICIISSDKPQDMLIRTVRLNEDLYKANRELCRDDYALFEDEAYKLQEEYFAKLEVVEEETPEPIAEDIPQE